MHPIITIATRAARQAGTVIMRHYEKRDQLQVSNKARNDYVSEVDRLAEQAIVDILRKTYPDHGILAEEGGHTTGDEHLWIIDPLDGTTNFLHGFPQFSVSIALQVKGRIEQAVVYNPVNDELYTASRGRGALMNSRRLRVSGAKELEGSLIGTGFPFKQPEHLDCYLQTFRALHTEVAGIRRAGSAALDLAFVASGRLDGFWEIGLNPWDMAAGVLLVEEAGGLIGDFAGGHDYMSSGNIVAGSPKIFKAILQKIRPLLSSTLQK
ncbi:MAG: inositol-1-monophosphatase [Gammaproteobacteria bacterium]|nr:inositol-1-monophosphatase [Gammaproteobacteria bacterium]